MKQRVSPKFSSLFWSACWEAGMSVTHVLIAGLIGVRAIDDLLSIFITYIWYMYLLTELGSLPPTVCQGHRYEEILFSGSASEIPQPYRYQFESGMGMNDLMDRFVMRA